MTPLVSVTMSQGPSPPPGFNPVVTVHHKRTRLDGAMKGQGTSDYVFTRNPEEHIKLRFIFSSFMKDRPKIYSW